MHSEPSDQPDLNPTMAHYRHVRPTYQPTVDGTMKLIRLGDVPLERGGSLPGVTLAYRTWGQLNDAGDNAVLILHALTGDSLAASDGGWWEPVIGAGHPVDTTRHFVVCSNVLGGCQGSTGPASRKADGSFWGADFPLLTLGDMVTAQRMLLERLGVRQAIIIGGSLGGCQALEWATRHSAMVRRTLCVAASGSLPALGIAIHGEVGRRAIMADPAWRGGNYLNEGTFPEQGLAIARMAAMVTYNSRQSLDTRFGRNAAQRPPLYPPFGQTFDVEGYLHYHGRALVRRFDANSYLYLTRAMEMWELERDGGDERWFGQITAPIEFIGISSDWLFPPEGIRLLAERMARAGVSTRYHEIDSPNGHDAFLKDWRELLPMVSGFMGRAQADGTGKEPGE